VAGPVGVALTVIPVGGGGGVAAIVNATDAVAVCPDADTVITALCEPAGKFDSTNVRLPLEIGPGAAAPPSTETEADVTALLTVAVIVADVPDTTAAAFVTVGATGGGGGAAGIVALNVFCTRCNTTTSPAAHFPAGI
jgi:hypothetical protein